MLYNIYQFVHESLGLCFWDIPALIVAALMVIVGLVHTGIRKSAKRNSRKNVKIILRHCVLRI